MVTKRANRLGLYKASVLGVISPKTSRIGNATAVAATVFRTTGSMKAGLVQEGNASSVREALRVEIETFNESINNYNETSK